MGTCLALFSRAAEADLRLDGDEGRMLSISLCNLNCCADRVDICSVFNGDRLEAECFHALFHVLAECDVCASLDGDTVGIVENDELSESKCSRKRESLRGNSLHHTAVTAEYICEMIDNRIIFLVEYGCQMFFSHCHTNCHTHTCAKRSGCSLNPNGVAVFRMSRSQGSDLTEVHEVFLCKTVSEQVKQGIQQHGAMSAG